MVGFPEVTRGLLGGEGLVVEPVRLTPLVQSGREQSGLVGVAASTCSVVLSILVVVVVVLGEEGCQSVEAELGAVWLGLGVWGWQAVCDWGEEVLTN